MNMINISTDLCETFYNNKDVKLEIRKNGHYVDNIYVNKDMIDNIVVVRCSKFQYNIDVTTSKTSFTVNIVTKNPVTDPTQDASDVKEFTDSLIWKLTHDD